MTPERYKKVKAVLDHRQPDLTVITGQVHKAHNIGSIIRTCNAVGITDIYCTEPRQSLWPFRRHFMGSYQWVTIYYRERVKDSAEILKQRGLKRYAAHFSDKSLPCNRIDFTCPCALIPGADK